MSPALAGGFFITSGTWEVLAIGSSAHFSRFRLYALIYDACFSLPPLPHSIRLTLCPLTSLRMTPLCSFCGWVAFHCVYIAHLLYPFLCWWIFMLLPCPACCKQCCNKHLGYSAQWDPAHLWPTFWVTRGYSISWRGSQILLYKAITWEASLKFRFLGLPLVGLRQNPGDPDSGGQSGNLAMKTTTSWALLSLPSFSRWSVLALRTQCVTPLLWASSSLSRKGNGNSVWRSPPWWLQRVNMQCPVQASVPGSG